METKHYGVKVPFLDKDDYLFITKEGGLLWNTTSLQEAETFANAWSDKAIVVELIEENTDGN